MSGRPAQRAIAAVACLTATLSRPLSAEEPQALAVDVVGSCPDRELVARELAPLLRGYTLTTDPAALTAGVEDLGERYRIRIAGAARDVNDAKRECLERARVAAVFLALNLPAPTQEARRAGSASQAPEPPPDAPPEPAAAAGPASATDRALALRLFATADSAWGARATAAGAGLGISLRWGALSLSLMGAATTATAPYQASEPSRRFELTRIPLAVLVGWNPGSSAVLSGGLEGGLALDLLGFEGKAVPNPAHQWRLNPGARLSAVMRVRASARLAAELSPTLAWYPRTYLVRVGPSQSLGETPALWAGLSLGLRYEIWGD